MARNPVPALARTFKKRAKQQLRAGTRAYKKARKAHPLPPDYRAAVNAPPPKKIPGEKGYREKLALRTAYKRILHGGVTSPGALLYDKMVAYAQTVTRDLSKKTRGS